MTRLRSASFSTLELLIVSIYFVSWRCQRWHRSKLRNPLRMELPSYRIYVINYVVFARDLLQRSRLVQGNFLA